LHRAFSVFLFNNSGQMLLQRRSMQKYHFKGLWSNACCGHPRPGESLADATSRRLFEEIGVDTRLNTLFSFIYRATDIQSGHTEYEYDHVLVGRFNGATSPCASEVEATRWASPDELTTDMGLHADRYTPWFLLVARKVMQTGVDA
jgi:isopentenyl-diphosphate delta-isomerase